MPTSADIAEHLGALLVGNGSVEITHFAPLYRAGKDALAYIDNSRYISQLKACQASAIILKPEWIPYNSGVSIVLDNPCLGYARASAYLNGHRYVSEGIHPSAVVADSAVVSPQVSVGANSSIAAGVHLAEGVKIGPGCHLGENVVIGDHTTIKANVVIERECKVGRRCLLQPGVVIGSDGFGYASDSDHWVHIPQLGRVLIGDRVEIGANTTIDRGAMDDTVIGDGVVLDNQIQVAHNVIIGENTAIAGCTGIAGSAKIGKRCTIGGATTVLGHLEIVDDVHINAMSLVVSSINQSGSYSSSTPLDRTARWRRNSIRFRDLDNMAKRINALERCRVDMVENAVKN